MPYLSSMTRHSEGKLKKLLDSVPQGFLVDTPWLASRDIDRKLAHYYVNNGWLDPVVQGLYRRPYSSSENPDAITGWKTTVLSLQTLMGYDVHIGGETALSVAGLTHYLQFSGPKTVYIYGDAPTWLKRIHADHKFIIRSRRLFRDNARAPHRGLKDAFMDQKEYRPVNTEHVPPWKWPLIISSPERAILEMLSELPKQANFHNVDMIFESLTGLRPGLMQDLLGNCRSIKAKRLFFVFADRHNHAWRKHIHSSRIDLGKGPRALIEGGKIHPKYHISVPKEFVVDNREGG